jgi:hypothetical protein
MKAFWEYVEILYFKWKKIDWKQVVVEAFAGFVGWTVALTPYMILVTKVTFEQYLWWVLMEIILVPPIAPIVIRFTSWLKKKILR